MGLFSWIKRNAADIVDPIGAVVGDNKYVNAARNLMSGGAAGLSDMGSRAIVEGAQENGLRGALGGLSDAASWGAGDVIQPLYTKETGDNPFYDRIGPIAAGYFGGPLAGGLADWWARGSEYDEVGNLNLGSAAGLFGKGWGGQGWGEKLLGKAKGFGGGASGTSSNILNSGNNFNYRIDPLSGQRIVTNPNLVSNLTSGLNAVQQAYPGIETGTSTAPIPTGNGGVATSNAAASAGGGGMLGTMGKTMGGLFSTKNIPQLAMTLASMGMSAAAAKKQQAAMEAALKANQGLYDQYSLPNQDLLNAQAVQNRGQLGQARSAAYRNLFNTMAARGFGSGSGLGTKGASQIEGNYVRSLGEMATELTKFGNTRQFAPPGSVYNTPTAGGTETALGKGANMLDQALGYMMMSNMINGGSNA
jgi:hypothetical protein